MSEFQDERINLILSIIRCKMASSQAFIQYLETERNYDGEVNLYMREAHLIRAIDPEKGNTMTELAQKMNVTQGAVSQTAKRVENKGYIVRTRSKENYRQTIACLTEKGKEFCKVHAQYDWDLMTALDKEYFFRFSEEELRALREYEEKTLALATKMNNKI